MGRRARLSLHGALAEVEADAWKCESCDNAAEENDVMCRYCRDYWNDVSAGFFDDDWADDELSRTTLKETEGERK